MNVKGVMFECLFRFIINCFCRKYLNYVCYIYIYRVALWDSVCFQLVYGFYSYVM